jgi:hypothetical protein
MLRHALELRGDDLRRMNVEDTKLLTIVTMSSKVTPDLEKPQSLRDGVDLVGTLEGSVKTEPFLFRIMRKRLQWAAGDRQYSTAALMWVVAMAHNPAQAVMLAYGLWRVAEKGPVTLDSLMLEDVSTLGDGIPTEEALMRLWDEQKDANAPLQNLLDDARTWGYEVVGDVMSDAGAD